MSADNYLFIDQETFAVYHRFASNVYGGEDPKAIRREDPIYKGESYRDATCWATHFEPNEYGIFVGTLCPSCEEEVNSDNPDYPFCSGCCPSCGHKKDKRQMSEIL